MGWFAALPALTQFAIGSTVVAGGLQYKASVDAGKAAEIGYKQQAQAERDAAQEREVERKRRLVSALGSQVNAAAAGNVDIGGGSPQAIARRDVQFAQGDYLADTASTQRRARSLLMQGRSAAAQGRLQGYASLVDTAGRGASLAI